MRILVLGHTGMLGHVVLDTLSNFMYNVYTTDYKWPAPEFTRFVIDGNFDCIVNCAASIPQSRDFNIIKSKMVNYELPMWLSSVCGKLIQPATNEEFAGNIDEDKFYTKYDELNATDDYGYYKKLASQYLVKCKNCYIIRTSIIGFELKRKNSILEWFLAQNSDIYGYVNHLWNGITTQRWAEYCIDILQDKISERVIQPYTEKISKFDLLMTFNEMFGTNKNIIPIENSKRKNTCLIDYSLEMDYIDELLTKIV